MLIDESPAYLLNKPSFCIIKLRIFKKIIMIKNEDIKYLKRCLSLAEEAVRSGDEAFGSLLVSKEGEVLAEARNRINEKNRLAHPEIKLAYWAADNLSMEECNETTMYTTGEHCPMCAAAHGWVGLGPIVYLSSGEQLKTWLREFGVEQKLGVNLVPVQQILPHLEVRGPAENELLHRIKSLHEQYFRGSRK